MSWPVGIYTRLRSSKFEAEGSLNDLRDYPFLAGASQLFRWEQLEPSPGVYPHMHWLKDQLDYLQPRNMGLVININHPSPAWLGENTPEDERYRSERDDRYIPVPWSAYALDRLKLLLGAIATTPVYDWTSNKTVKFCQHPSFVGVKVYAPIGMGRLFEPADNPKFRDMPGYTRAKFITGLKQALERHWVQFQMGTQPGRQLGFWMDTFALVDYTSSPPLWQDYMASMLSQFNGSSRPYLTMGQENCATSRPAPNTNPVTFRPTESMRIPFQDYPGPIAWEPLGAWSSKPSADIYPKIQYSNPAECLAALYQRYGGKYLQLYIEDTDRQEWHPQFQAWANFYRSGVFPAIPVIVYPS